jgi:hypothetical protein
MQRVSNTGSAMDALSFVLLVIFAMIAVGIVFLFVATWLGPDDYWY